MTFAEFEGHAAREWERIPDEFKAGVDALTISRDARSHGSAHGVYTLGECVTESYPSDFGGPDTIRSELRLYYGSFRRLAAGDPDFHWDDEIWETLTHELKHHLESLASRDDLGDLDAAAEENFKRLDGQPFDPLYFRAGEAVDDGRFMLDDTTFIEAVGPRDRPFSFDWNGDTYAIILPENDADVLYLSVHGLGDASGEVLVVSVLDRSPASRLLAFLRRRAITVACADVSAVRP